MASVEHTLLATLTFVRGLAAHPSCAATFCSSAWTDLLLGLVESHVALSPDQVGEFLAGGAGEPTQQLTSAVSGSQSMLWNWCDGNRSCRFSF